MNVTGGICFTFFFLPGLNHPYLTYNKCMKRIIASQNATSLMYNMHMQAH